MGLCSRHAGSQRSAVTATYAITSFVESNVVIGDGVTIKNGVAIWDGVTLGNHVFVGPNAVFTNDLNPRAEVKKGHDQFVPTHDSGGCHDRCQRHHRLRRDAWPILLRGSRHGGDSRRSLLRAAWLAILLDKSATCANAASVCLNPWCASAAIVSSPV